MMKTIRLLSILLLLTGIQSCASNNFQRQKYTNFGKAKGLHLLPASDSKNAAVKDNLSTEMEATEETTNESELLTEAEVPQWSVQDANDSPSENELTETTEETATAASEPADTISRPIEVIDADEMRRKFTVVSISGYAVTVFATLTTFMAFAAVETTGSVLMFLFPMGFAILALVLLAIAVKRGRNLNKVYKAVDYDGDRVFYLLYALDILLLFAASFAVLYVVVILLLVIALLAGGGW